MNKKLKSYHKLFFTILFSILFFNLIGSENNPNLSDKIAPELERIEALPRRTKPAELNIEVTKLKSETLDSIYFSPKEKALYIDFSKYYNADNFKNIDTNRYELFISDKIENAAFVNSGNNRKQIYKSRETVQERYSHKMVYKNNKKLLMIENIQDSSPKNLYLGIFDKNTNQVVKVFKANFEGKILESVDIETREVHIVYDLFSDRAPNYSEEVTFTLDGTPDKSYVKVYQFSGFTNALPSSKDGTKIKGIMNKALLDGSNVIIEKQRNKNDNTTLEFDFVVAATGGTNTTIKVKYKPDGSLTLQVLNGQRSPQIIDFIHQDSSGNVVKMHRLNIYSKTDYQKPKFAYTLNKFDILLTDSTTSATELKAATIAVKTDYLTTGANLTGLKVFPILSLNEMSSVVKPGNTLIDSKKYYLYPGDYLKDGSAGTTGATFPIIISGSDTGSIAYFKDITKTIYPGATGYPYVGKYNKSTNSFESKHIMVGRYRPTSKDGTGTKLPENVAVELIIKLSDADLKYIRDNDIKNIKFDTPYSQYKKIFLFSGVERSIGAEFAGVAPDYKEAIPFDRTYIEILNAFPYEIYYKEIVKRGVWKLTIDPRFTPSKDAPIIIDNERPKSTPLLTIEKSTGETPRRPSSTENLSIIYNNNTDFVLATPKEFILEKGNKIVLNLDVDGNVIIKPTYWNPGTLDEFILKYTNKATGKTVGEYTFKVYPPSYFISGNGVLDFEDIVKGNEKIANTFIDIDYAVAPGLAPELSLKLPSDSPDSTSLYLKHENDQTKKLLVTELSLGKESIDNTSRKMQIPLSGKIQTTQTTEVGKYSNQIEILIYLK